MIISHSNALFQEKAEYLSKLRIIKKNLILLVKEMVFILLKMEIIGKELFMHGIHMV